MAVVAVAPAAAAQKVAARRAAHAASIVASGSVTAVDVSSGTITVTVGGGRPSGLHGTTTTFSVAADAVVARDEVAATLGAPAAR